MNLLVIQHEDVRVVLKGTYDSSKNLPSSGEVAMQLHCSSSSALIEVYDGQQLTPYEGQSLAPIFFENGRYELVLIPNNGAEISFAHEYDRFKEAVSEVADTGIFTGILHFQSEVGLSQMEVQKDGVTLFTFTIEVFPTKLDYQNDYVALLDEVNEEIYNLAYSFIKKTYLNAARKRYKDPSYTEFYRILEIHVKDFIDAIQHVERSPHHQFETTYEEVRGDRLRKQDSRGLHYLRKNARHFVDVERGIAIGNRNVMPEKGLLMKKQHNFDTHENRYVKWAIERIHSRIVQLKVNHLKVTKQNKREPNQSFVDKLDKWITFFRQTLQKTFWRKIGKLDRSVYSLVMQMATGYKDVFQIYTFLSQSLVLQNDIYKMSVKDIATLYEYWTFLKLGKILASKTDVKEQDIVKVNSNGLYLNLMSGQMVTRTFEQTLTKEKIQLRYQYKAHHTPTVNQEPDTMLSIEKHGSSGAFCYIFDAKYAIHVDTNHGIGPEHRDINVMHRYRDAIVANNGDTYEREMFGAYVLFPWKNDVAYRDHPLYKSIDEVNIGGLPFLPNETKLVEQIIDNLLHKSGEELQREGILPRGAMPYLASPVGNLLVIHEQYLQSSEWGENEFVPQLIVPRGVLPDGALQVQEIAIASDEGIHTVVVILGIEVGEQVIFNTVNKQSHLLKVNNPYSWNQVFIVSIKVFNAADHLEELFVRNETEHELVKLFKRISADVVLKLDDVHIKGSSVINEIQLGKHKFQLDEQKLSYGDSFISLETPSFGIFKWVKERLISTSDF